MRPCPRCGTENPDGSDFCTSCGEYLRWEPTRAVSAVTHGEVEVPRPPPPREEPEPPPPTPSRPDAVMLTVRTPDADAADSGSPSVRLEPGARGRLMAFVRNQSGIVDNYELTVRGLPDGWWTIEPDTIYLVPYGAGAGTYEQEAVVELHPPRAAEAQARTWPIEVVAVSKAAGAEVAAAPAVLEIGPYAELSAELTPDLASGRRRAYFTVAVENRANAAADVELDALDTEGRCRFGFEQRRMTVAPGQRAETRMRVRPPRPIWIGRPLERRFEVTARPLGREGTPPTCPGVFRQRSLLPWWLPVAIAPLLLIALLLLLLIPKSTTVPDLTGAKNTFEAQTILDGAGLKLSPQIQQKQVAGKPAGAIVDQTPKAGAKVDKGSAVTLLVAVGSGKRTVPSVVGLTPVEADKALRAAGLALGAIAPQPDIKAKISSQIPAAQELVADGTPVNVFLPAANPQAGAGAVALPKLAGLTAAAAGAKLAAAGLTPQPTPQIAEAKPGTLVGTDPPEGTQLAKGATVKLLVSAGFPQIAFDNGGDVIVASGTGKGAKALAKGPGTQEEPTWSADGSHVAYRSGTQIVVVAPGGSGAEVAVTPANQDARDPAFAPTTDANVLAFIRKTGDDSDLCFVTVGTKIGKPACIKDPRFDIGPPISWSPDGASILALAVTRDNEKRFGLIRYTTQVPFSARASDWDKGTVVTDTSQAGRGVIAGALSPDGKQLAVVSNLDAPQFHLLLTKPADFRLSQAQSLPVRACTVAWRPDGLALAVVQSDAQCQEPVGQLLGIDPAKPSVATTLRPNAAHPAWQPIKLTP
jgi:beta-lactam-binding protein with PASTA domain